MKAAVGASIQGCFLLEDFIGASNILVSHYGTSLDTEIGIGSSKPDTKVVIGHCTIDYLEKIGLGNS